MSNVSQFSSKETIRTRACEWIAAIDRGLTRQESLELKNWIQASTSHQKALFEMAALWDDLSVMNTLRGLMPRQPREHRMKTKQWFAAAAVAAIMLTGIISWQWQQTPGSASHEIAHTQQSQTQVGEQKTIRLADGSRVFLNTNTAIRVSFYPHARHVELLRGEAHFEVARDPSRPFTVAAGDNAVTAVGTAFNMQYTQARAFELTVTEGKVRVTPLPGDTDEDANPVAQVIKQEGVMVFAGEKVLVDNAVSPRESLTQSEIAQSLAWQDGQIVFTGEKLTDALIEISRYTEVKFVIDDDSLNDTRVAGYFRVGDIKGLLVALENSFAITAYEAADNSIHLRANQGS